VHDGDRDLAWLPDLLADTGGRLGVLLWFGSDPDQQRIARAEAARGVRDSWVSYRLAVAALADRRIREAVGHAQSAQPGGESSAFLLAYTLALSGRSGEARALFPQVGARRSAFLEWTLGGKGPP
jgi:hypothetical protein